MLDWLGQLLILSGCWPWLIGVPHGRTTSARVRALVDLLPVALSLAWLVVRQLHRAALASPFLSGIAPALANHGHGHPDGGGDSPLVGESQREVWLVYRQDRWFGWAFLWLGR